MHTSMSVVHAEKRRSRILRQRENVSMCIFHSNSPALHATGADFQFGILTACRLLHRDRFRQSLSHFPMFFRQRFLFDYFPPIFFSFLSNTQNQEIKATPNLTLQSRIKAIRENFAFFHISHNSYRMTFNGFYPFIFFHFIHLRAEIKKKTLRCHVVF